MELQFRSATVGDAEQVAGLHADSWQRNYRGAFADSFLDGDVIADRLAVWSKRLVAPVDAETIVAEQDGRLAGFVHVEFDLDPDWGSLVDNLHVVHGRKRSGIGTQLLRHAARAVVDRAVGDAMYLWVLEQNSAAQGFYVASGATRGERVPAPPPGGDPARLNGVPLSYRMVWPDASTVNR